MTEVERVLYGEVEELKEVDVAITRGVTIGVEGVADDEFDYEEMDVMNVAPLDQREGVEVEYHGNQAVAYLAMEDVLTFAAGSTHDVQAYLEQEDTQIALEVRGDSPLERNIQDDGNERYIQAEDAGRYSRDGAEDPLDSDNAYKRIQVDEEVDEETVQEYVDDERGKLERKEREMKEELEPEILEPGSKEAQDIAEDAVEP